MKAAILVNQNEPLEVDVITPSKLSYGQVLVRIEASSICGRQIGEITGSKGEDKFLPHLLGHEGGGIIEEVGPGVKSVKAGDKVVMHWRKGEGIESDFPKYDWNGKTIGGGLVTTFAEYSIASENRVTPIPDSIPSEIAALLGCAVTTALGLMNNEAKMKIGQSITIIGVGGVGLNVVQSANMVSANPIIAVDISNEKLKLAKQLGANYIVNNKDNNITSDVMDIVGSKGVDVVVETSGIPHLIESAYELTANMGRMIMVGQPHYTKDLTIKNMANNFIGKTIKDSQGGLTDPAIDIPRYIELYKNGKLDLNRIITNTYRLEDINQAIDNIKQGMVTGKCIVKMD